MTKLFCPIQKKWRSPVRVKFVLKAADGVRKRFLRQVHLWLGVFSGTHLLQYTNYGKWQLSIAESKFSTLRMSQCIITQVLSSQQLV